MKRDPGMSSLKSGSLFIYSYWARLATKSNRRLLVAVHNAARPEPITFLFGRRKVEVGDEFPELYTEWKQGHMTAVECWKKLWLEISTFYRRVKEY